MFIIVIALFVLFLLLSFFFSGSETGLISIDRYMLERDSKQNKSKKELLRFLKHPDRFMGTTLIGNNISLVIVSSLFTAHIAPSLKVAPWLEGFLPLIMAGFMLLFAEILPKAIYRDKANTIVPKTFGLLKFFYTMLKPLVLLVTVLNRFLRKLFGLSNQEALQSLSIEDLSFILSETKSDKNLAEPQKEMIAEALEFNQLDAKNVMIPRTEVIGLSVDTPITEVIARANADGFTRYPVYEDSIDNVKGILIIYDLLKLKDVNKGVAKDFARPAFFAPENMDVPVLLAEMQKQRVSMAIIVDSYGGTAGLVTTEDIIEEIVGEIEDEYDKEETQNAEVIMITENSYLVKGFTEIDTLLDDYAIELPQGDYETIAGLIINKIAKIPNKGFTIRLGKWLLEVVQVSNRKIELVKLTRK